MPAHPVWSGVVNRYMNIFGCLGRYLSSAFTRKFEEKHWLQNTSFLRLKLLPEKKINSQEVNR